MSSRYPGWTEVTRHRTRLSVAVRLVDALTDEELSGVVSIAGFDASPTRHHSGYYLFIDLPSNLRWTLVPEVTGYRTDPVLLRVPPDPFVRETGPIQVPSSLPGTRPVLELGLYGADATIVHGKVTRDGASIAGTTVSVSGIDLTTETDERGCYVLVFGEDDGASIVEAAGERRLKIAGHNPEFVAVDDPDAPTPAERRRRVVIPVGAVTEVEFGFS